MKMRVWAEYVTPQEALKPDVMKLLKRYGVALGMAFPPGSVNADYARMLKAYSDEGIEVALWALLPDEQGYWVCERNASEFTDYIKSIYDWADKEKFTIPCVAVDLELPHYQMSEVKSQKNMLQKGSSLIKFMRQNRDKARFYEASRKFELLNEFIHSRGATTLCPISDLVVHDLAAGGTAFQDMLETPVSTVNWDMLSVMIYTSMIAGYSKGLLRPEDARRHLYTTMRAMKEVMGDRAGVSIGVTYVGKLEDEPYYETPRELLPDMQAAKAAGVEDITIYNLEGILRSARPEEWFETLLSAEPKEPGHSVRAEALRAVCAAVARFG